MIVAQKHVTSNEDDAPFGSRFKGGSSGGKQKNLDGFLRLSGIKDLDWEWGVLPEVKIEPIEKDNATATTLPVVKEERSTTINTIETQPAPQRSIQQFEEMFNLEWQWGIFGAQIDPRLEGGACIITFTAVAAVESIFNIEGKVDLVHIRQLEVNRSTECQIATVYKLGYSSFQYVIRAPFCGERTQIYSLRPSSTAVFVDAPDSEPYEGEEPL
ncbi:hypothetical protein H0H93_011830 [Arthromyces matolae]|nr:hypothetical protein H0H93_011830 [Arthromyces matolae]